MRTNISLKKYLYSGSRFCAMNALWPVTLHSIFLAALMVEVTDNCGDVPVIPNAFPETNVKPPFAVGSGVKYECNSGFKIVNGNNVAVCQDINGTQVWKVPTLQCDFEGCGAVPELHQRVPRDEESLGSPPYPLATTVSYKCDTGYVTQGGSTDAVCIVKGGRAQWEPPSFTCRGISCGDPKIVKHATREGHVFTFPHNVTYVCQKGYETEENTVLHCLPNALWSHDGPVCKVIQCRSLPNPENGVVEIKEPTYGSEAKYSCSDGYRLEGNRKRECLANKMWSGQAPNCTKITCPPIEQVPHGRAINLPHAVIIACDPPDSTRVTVKCFPNGQWQPAIPKCKGKPTTVAPVTEVVTEPQQPILRTQCGNPGNISNGRVSHDNDTFPVNFNLTYNCATGYTMKGEASLRCNALGKWIPGVVPACEKPLSLEVIIGIVLGVVVLVALLVAGGLLCVRWRKKQIARRNKACIIDAKDCEEIRTLERDRKYIPVTSL